MKLNILGGVLPIRMVLVGRCVRLKHLSPEPPREVLWPESINPPRQISRCFPPPERRGCLVKWLTIWLTAPWPSLMADWGLTTPRPPCPHHASPCLTTLVMTLPYLTASTAASRFKWLAGYYIWSICWPLSIPTSTKTWAIDSVGGFRSDCISNQI